MKFTPSRRGIWAELRTRDTLPFRTERAIPKRRDAFSVFLESSKRVVRENIFFIPSAGLSLSHLN